MSQAHNTRVLSSRRTGDLRFVHDEEEGKPGPVISRAMTADEREKYGMAVYKKKSLTMREILSGIKVCPNLASAARRSKVSVDTYLGEMLRNEVDMPKKWEEEEMGDKAKSNNGNGSNDSNGAKTAVSKMTLTEALQRKDELILDTQELFTLKDTVASPRIKDKLTFGYDEGMAELVKIEKALGEVTIEI